MTDHSTFVEQDVSLLLFQLRKISNAEAEKEDVDNSVKLFITSVIYPLLSSENTESMVKNDLDNLIKTARLILNSIIEAANYEQSSIKKLKGGLKYVRDFRKKYPYYVQLDHPEEAIKFYNLLDKDEYTQLAAANLLNLTRQTISTYVKNGTHGFKSSNNSKMVKKEEIYNYYLKYIIKKKWS